MRQWRTASRHSAQSLPLLAMRIAEFPPETAPMNSESPEISRVHAEIFPVT